MIGRLTPFRFFPVVCLAMLILPACSAINAVKTPERINLPIVNSVNLDRQAIPRYESLELEVSLQAEYANPYDVRQVSLVADFTAPDGKVWRIPGFWDAADSWRVRFTPSQVGKWSARVTVTDKNGTSLPWEGQFAVSPSNLHGWIQVGSRVNPQYSSHYLAYHDGTPFYGFGHCNAFDLMTFGYDEQEGFTLFTQMAQQGENLLVYWPIYSNPFFNTRYDDYSKPDLKILDMVVDDAMRKGIFLAFTIWDHPELRDETHPWGDGLWSSQNGFRQLVDLNAFFTDEEA